MIILMNDYTHEINFTISNKLLDIMSFSETRLNSTIPA